LRFNPAQGGLLDEPLLMQSNAAGSRLEKLRWKLGMHKGSRKEKRRIDDEAR